MLPSPPAVRKVLSSALIGAAKSASDVSSRLWVREIKPCTPLADLIGGRSLGESAFTDVSGAISVGTDHFHALARVVRLPEELGPSIATLVRGTIEAFGRAWWLLEVQDTVVMDHRSAVMRLAELTTAKRRGLAIGRLQRNGTRQRIDIDVAIDEAKEYLADKQPEHQTLTMPGYTTLATNVMTAAGVRNSATQYSQLSGAAHGENLTALGFSSVQHGVGKLGLPYRYLDMYSWTVLHVVDLIVTHVIDLWDADDERQRWASQRDRTYGSFDAWHDMLTNY